MLTTNNVDGLVMDDSVIYLDNAATTRPSAAALKTFYEAAKVCYGNPSSLHLLGRRAKEVLEDARGKVAQAISARQDEIFFTSGGTEADNLALFGITARHPDKKRIIISAVEHPAVYKTCRALKKRGYEIVKIPVSLDGSIDEGYLRSAVDYNTALVSFMTVNNETGTIFPIKRIVEIAKSKNPTAIVHSDAVQALGKIPLEVGDMGVDLMSLSAHKVHGLKGSGALYVKSGTELYPMQFGGGQEGGLRSGTEAASLALAFGVAACEAVVDLRALEQTLRPLQALLFERLAGLDGVTINSQITGTPHIVNISIPKFDASWMVKQLSARGICISRGAACKSNHEHGPSMLMSFGLSAKVADAALRISLSKDNTQAEIERAIEEIKRLLLAGNDV